MNLRKIINAVSTPDGVDNEAALDMEVEFCTLGRDGLTLLSAYEHDGKILVDIGTSEDDEKNMEMLGYQ